MYLDEVFKGHLGVGVRVLSVSKITYINSGDFYKVEFKGFIDFEGKIVNIHLLYREILPLDVEGYIYEREAKVSNEELKEIIEMLSLKDYMTFIDELVYEIQSLVMSSILN